jgi:hypothetical protein
LLLTFMPQSYNNNFEIANKNDKNNDADDEYEGF